MRLLNAPMRLALVLGLASMSLMLGAYSLGLFPNPARAKAERHAALCETLAVNNSLLASRGMTQAMQTSLRLFLERNPDVMAIELQSHDGRVDVRIDRPPREDALEEESTLDKFKRSATTLETVTVPIFAQSREWGQLTVEFAIEPTRIGRLPLDRKFLAFAIFVAAASVLTFWHTLRKILKHLDPTGMIPDRVREALDTLSEGLVLMDRGNRIVYANKAFAERTGISREKIVGRPSTAIPWSIEGAATAGPLPWDQARGGQPSQGQRLVMRTGKDQPAAVFQVSSAPIVDDKGHTKGTITSFEDVTELHQKNAELTQLLDVLRESREEIRRQNEDLRILATRDPLTGCLNRRSLFESFQRSFDEANQSSWPLSCVMLDIDRFKSINDNHGHSRGDEVLRHLSKILHGVGSDDDLIGRYGGEEFCWVLPGQSLAAAAAAAERLRAVLEASPVGDLKVTASLGVSALASGIASPQELIELADRALYAAKRGGRNRVIRADEIPADAPAPEPKSMPHALPLREIGPIPFPAVTALISALSYRDPETALHSCRVADLAAAMARELLPIREAYVVEVAALLHDIGKIGVPDAILLKPGALTQEEWKVMALHDRFGVEIVASAFQCEALTETVRHHHAPFAGDPSQPRRPRGTEIPLGARIVTICDAFDAMVSDRVYRKGRTAEAAFEELRRCAGRQFDPELVEIFVALVTERNPSAATFQNTPGGISKETAMRLGAEMESIAAAVGDQDWEGLHALAFRLSETAQRLGLADVATAADRLTQAAGADESRRNLTLVVQATFALMDLCRGLQRVHALRATVEPSGHDDHEAQPAPLKRLPLAPAGQPALALSN